MICMCECKLFMNEFRNEYECFVFSFFVMHTIPYDNALINSTTDTRNVFINEKMFIDF